MELDGPEVRANEIAIKEKSNNSFKNRLSEKKSILQDIAFILAAAVIVVLFVVLL